jgi:nucleoid-associated protein YgaU
MAEGSSKKLTITSCTMDQSGTINATGPSFEVMMNPSGYTHQRSIEYSDIAATGSAGRTNIFDKMGQETITFDEMIIDSTGAVPTTVTASTGSDVKAQVDALTKIVYNYSGNNHEPPWVRLLWGTLIFFGRLSSMTLNYTLFKPNGEPLRAKVNLEFRGAMSPQEEALRANRSSPDLSHRIRVVDGDTLPLLCYRIYRDSSYYPEVAKFNGLTDFRNLKPGTVLLFPPLT